MRVMKSAVIALVFTAVTVSGFAGGKSCQAGKARVFADDHIIFANGIGDVDMDALTSRYGKTFLYMERGSKAYLVTEADTLDRVRHILLPQSRLSQQQAALGTKQAALGLKQAQLGMQQIGASEAKQRELERKQKELGKQQEALGARQEALQTETDKAVDAILDQAISRGIAKLVR